jgi:hypothetical protein
MTSTEKLREELYAWCGRSIACRRAADYYIMMLQNPCYPAGKMTYKMRKFYIEIVERYGRPPRCDVKALVAERMRGMIPEEYVDEIAELAERLRSELNITSRVAAAVAAVVVAERRGIAAVRYLYAARFGASYAAVKAHIRKAYELYSKKNVDMRRP